MSYLEVSGYVIEPPYFWERKNPTHTQVYL